MTLNKESADTIRIGLGVSMAITFSYGLLCLFTPMDESKGIGLMLATMILQNWKKKIEGII